MNDEADGYGFPIMRWRLPSFAAAACVAAAWVPGTAAADEALPIWRPVTAENRAFVQLRELAARFTMRTSPSADGRILLSNRWHALRFKANSREALVDGTAVWLNAPLTQVRGQWAVYHADAALLLDPILRPELYLRAYRPAVVLIDPGHGGKDTGAIGPSGLCEKDLTLDIARRVRAALANAGLRARLTRDNDRLVELGERSTMIGRTRADVFVSIHLNSASDRGARGIETYILSALGFQSTNAGGGPSPRSEAMNGHRQAAANAILAHGIQRQLRQQTGLPDRGLRHAHYAVLKNATCPAALVECGFLSNPQDEALLRGAAHRDRIAAAIAAGIRDYVRAADSSRRGAGTSSVAETSGNHSPRLTF